ncbi:hypothetical protein, conserved [Leishmania tarentolae]|uniref:Uncharacterized protein n=1 Tax=Leishmania tarentolae TaxID=5689 RepID=A0A640KJN2_LEITA|nr:hypothetical protein, conserved [Leishmania tarentolae]
MSISSRISYRRPLRRVLLRVSALAVFFCVMFAYAAAPVYEVNNVKVIVENTFDSTWRSSHIQVCEAKGGVLVPDVSDALHQKLVNKMMAAGAVRYCGYLGGSTLLSPNRCTTSKASLSCTWYWDQGRYSGVENAYPFYKGNYFPASGSNGGLPGAGMLSTSSSNYWVKQKGMQVFPGQKHERYAMLILSPSSSVEGWVDSSEGSFSYGVATTNPYYAMCLVEPAATTTTTTTTTPTAAILPIVPTRATTIPTTTLIPLTDSNESEAQTERGKKVTMWIGISIFIFVVSVISFALIVSKARQNGWCCFARKALPLDTSRKADELMSPPTLLSEKPRRSRRPSRWSTSSLCSKDSSGGTERSFHTVTPYKDGPRPRSILQSADENMETNLERCDASFRYRSEDFVMGKELDPMIQKARIPLFDSEQHMFSILPVELDDASTDRESFSDESSCTSDSSESSREHDVFIPQRRLRRKPSVSFID